MVCCAGFWVANCQQIAIIPLIWTEFFCVVLVFVLLVACVLPKTSTFSRFNPRFRWLPPCRHLEGWRAVSLGEGQSLVGLAGKLFWCFFMKRDMDKRSIDKWKFGNVYLLRMWETLKFAGWLYAFINQFPIKMRVFGGGMWVEGNDHYFLYVFCRLVS